MQTILIHNAAPLEVFWGPLLDPWLKTTDVKN